MLKFNRKLVLPLVSSAFEPGTAKKTVEQIADEDEKQMALAELHYFSGQAEECAKITEAYLEHEELGYRLTACLLFCFSSLTLGNASDAKRSVQIVRACLEHVFQQDLDNETKAACVFAAYLSTVLLHAPSEGLPSLETYNIYLPRGTRLYAMYILAHEAYLQGDYGRALGMAQASTMFIDTMYPIPNIYLRCIISMCYINLKEQEKAREMFLSAWDLAKKDAFIEPFIEHHGLFQGMIESCVRKEEPQLYKSIGKGVLAFSRGWIKMHNPTTKNRVTELLTPMEFSIAMLACRDWSNQEIAEYLDLSVNTVKHYVSTILEKLEISKREQIKDFVNR